MRGSVFLRAKFGANGRVNQPAVDAAFFAQPDDRVLVNLPVAVLVCPVVRERAEHEELREFMVAERRHFCECRCIVKAQLSGFIIVPAQDLTDRPLVFGGDAPEELLNGFVQVLPVERPGVRFDRLDHDALPHGLVNANVEEFLLPFAAVFRRSGGSSARR